MKRNWELIRTILMTIEATSDSKFLRLSDFDHPNKHEITYHVSLLIDAGLIDATINKTMSLEAHDFLIRGLTWEGHEFIDSIKNDSIWDKVKEAFKKQSISMTFETVKTIANTVITSFLTGN